MSLASTWYDPLLVATGATSALWRVSLAEGQKAALKLGFGPAQAAVLAAEGSLCLGLRAPQLPRLLGAGWTTAPEGGGPERPFLLLRWLDGSPLSELLPARSGEELLWLVARDVSAALEHLHRLGLAHGDVKPSNMQVTQDRVALLDLGLAGDAARPSPSGGTPRYLPPELFAGRESDGRGRDLWALGLCLLEAGGGELPSDWTASSPLPPLPPTLSARSRRLLSALLATTPGARPTAAWVRSQAEEALTTVAQAPSHDDVLREAYLVQRREELLVAAHARSQQWVFEGPTRSWLEDELTTARGIRSLLPPLAETATHEWHPLGVAERSDWLWRLTASPHARRHGSLESETVLVELLRQDPLLIDGAHTKDAPAATTLALAWRLARGTAGRLDIVQAEHLTGKGQSELLVPLGTHLRRRGEYGRALAAFHAAGPSNAGVAPLSVASMESHFAGRLPPEEVRELIVLWADTARRAGLYQEARTLVAPLAPAHPEACAVAARLAWDEGDASLFTALTSDHTGWPMAEPQCLAAVASGDWAKARYWAEEAFHGAMTSEDMQRASALIAYVAQLAGAPAEAREQLLRAIQLALSAGSALDEAHLQTSLASACADLGRSSEALTAARRAQSLFGWLQRPAAAARATATEANTWLQLGARNEAVRAAERAAFFAEAGGDRLCEGYALLIAAEAQPETAPLHLERAHAALALHGPSARLVELVTQLAVGAAPPREEGDRLARNSSLPASERLRWWSWRVVEANPEELSQIFMEALPLLSLVAPPGVLGPAAARLWRAARHAGRGEIALRLSQVVTEAARTLRDHVPTELGAERMHLSWAQELDYVQPSAIAPAQLAQLQHLVRQLSERGRLRPLLDGLLDALLLWTGVERGMVLLRAPGGALIPRASRNLGAEDLRGEQLQISRTIAQRAIDSRQPISAADLPLEHHQLQESLHQLRLRSVLAIPLNRGDEVLGVVYLDDRLRAGAFDSASLQWAQLLTMLAALALGDTLDRLRLQRALRRANRMEARLAGELEEQHARLVEEQRASAAHPSAASPLGRILGVSDATRRLREAIGRAARTEFPVVLQGESGSGKELAARALHDASSRAAGPFLAENCGAIPSGLLEATLFGHVRGAFTGAIRSRAGLFQLAHGGTLFLDEIGEMPTEMQTRLLRVLEERTVTPLGGERPIPIDVRVVAASHRDLGRLVEEGRFRQDLFYRLSVLVITIPPLRERDFDVVLLAERILHELSPSRPRPLTDEAKAALLQAPWPGNVRQLQNVLRRAVVFHDGPIPAEAILETDTVAATMERLPLHLPTQRAALERQLIDLALSRCAGNQTQAARLLGISRFGLQKMLRRLYSTEPRSDSSPPP